VPKSAAEAGLGPSASVPPDLGLAYLASPLSGIEVTARLCHADLDEAIAVTGRSASATAWQSVPLS